ncbi:hypothetical protein Metli_2296 [Methanofollis liminatans DSM 4140]|uniref:DUF7982 domain-containing protein n=1 Tax=Methanofollis liminatans DSM 4140 TaxID=28892 RepID=J0SBW4_9EURY|nr:hypothetical protein [Methanofollis liminatans]EJG08234.1 hypothetical protein Metli_2296 [Methanofollis liminatans DSM 4140]
MKLSDLNDTYLAAFLLLGAAAAALIVATLTGRGDLTSATLVLAGFGSFIAGVFLLALYKGEPMDPAVAALLPVQGTVGIATLIADLGVQGDALFMPPGEDGTVVEVVPAGANVPSSLPAGYSYVTAADGAAVVMAPLAAPLLDHLKRSCSLEIPSDREQLCEAIVEIFGNVLEVAGPVTARFEGENLVIDLRNFTLLKGCQAVRKASPKCCTMVGCPICSLAACVAAEGLAAPCRIASAVPSGDGLQIIIEQAA